MESLVIYLILTAGILDLAVILTIESVKGGTAMGAKSAMEARFSNREGFSIVSVPKSMRPTAESIEKMGRRISAQIRSNNAMRDRSVSSAAERSVN